MRDDGLGKLQTCGEIGVEGENMRRWNRRDRLESCIGMMRQLLASSTCAPLSEKARESSCAGPLHYAISVSCRVNREHIFRMLQLEDLDTYTALLD